MRQIEDYARFSLECKIYLVEDRTLSDKKYFVTNGTIGIFGNNRKKLVTTLLTMTNQRV